MFEIMPESEGNVVGIKASGILEDADYKEIIPKAEKKIEEVGDVNVLLDISEMKGFTCHAFLDDAKFCIRFGDKMKKIAMVGHSKWEKDATLLSKPFMPGEIKYFDVADRAAAWEWLKA